MSKKPSIKELESMLNDDNLEIELRPDGSVKAVQKGTAEFSKPEILTLSSVVDCDKNNALDLIDQISRYVHYMDSNVQKITVTAGFLREIAAELRRGV